MPIGTAMIVAWILIALGALIAIGQIKVGRARMPFALGLTFGIAALIFFVPGVTDFFGGAGTGALTVATTAGIPQTPQLPSPTSLAVSCGDTPATTLTVTAQNTLNTTGSETFAITHYLYEIIDGTENFANTSTSGLSDANCGSSYVLKGLAANGDSGDNSMVNTVLASSGLGNVLVEDGQVAFTVTRPNPSIRLGMTQHAAVEGRCFDVLNDAFMFDSTSDESALDYDTLNGLNCTGTTDDNTSRTVGAGGELHSKWFIRATRPDVDLKDAGLLYLADANTDIWQVPSVSFNGVLRTSDKAILTAEETRDATNYEYAYDVSDVNIRGSGAPGFKEAELDFHVFGLSGVNPSGANSPNHTLWPRGNYLSIDGTTVKRGAVDDTSGGAEVFTGITFVDSIN